MLAVWASAAHACSCIPANPAAKLASADAALVGTVEAKAQAPEGGTTYTVRVERALKGELGERVTLHSAMTSCHVEYAVGARIAVVLYGPSQDWDVGTCNSVDVRSLLAAAELPPPSGTARFVAAVEDDTVDAVALAANGKPAGYGWREGRPVALASCGRSATATAFAGSSGRVRVSIRALPDMIGAGSESRLALSRVSALSCDASARRFWIAGEQGGRTVVIAVERRRSSLRLHSAPAGAAVSFSGGRAYVASAGRVDVVTLSSGKVRSVRHGGAFRSLSVASGRIAGRLRSGRAAILDLASGRLRTGRRVDGLVWLSRTSLLDAGNGAVLDPRLKLVRRLSGTVGRVVGVRNGSAYLASGALVRRLKPGATRAEVFAELPGKVVALTLVAPTASVAWHSCQKSANSP
ncbi:MAG TPA: hypothetical protein VF230_03510 [Acidimicrobiales bacterium]